MKLTLILSLFLLLQTCHHDKGSLKVFRKVSDLESAITSRTKLFHQVTIDSAELTNKILTVYFTNTLDRVNPVVTYQIVEYSLEPLRNQDKIAYDSLRVIFKMPKRNNGDIVLRLAKNDVFSEWKLFENEKFAKAVDTLMHINAASTDSTFLESLNIDFAKLTYGQKYEQEAFFGFDTYKIIYGALQECESGTRGDISKLVDLQLDRYQNTEFKKRIEMEKIFRPVLNCK